MLCQRFTSILLLAGSIRASFLPAEPHSHRRTVRPTSTSKAGLAWPNGNGIDITQFLNTGKVTWYYTWSPYPVNTDIEFVPLLWGADQTEQWNQTISDTIKTLQPTAVLGMNEPQETSQSNLTPEEGAAMWKTYIQPLKQQGLRLGSPAPSSAPSGKQWLLSWLNSSCSDCTVDFIALHWYDVNATAFIEYLEDFHNTFQRPIWVTEWTCQNFNNINAQCSYQDIVTFMNITQSFMDRTDWVERYAWFGAMENLQGVNPDDALMTSKGKINPLGLQYIAANSSTNVPQAPGSSNGASPGFNGAHTLFSMFLPNVFMIVMFCIGSIFVHI
ncbi:glycoside hydrolase family 128 protein [Sphaerobolus stellatus SS14]|nr:glycoside hydrolase family 128 protein [Sphaerobolus stellatus SS14]